MSDSFNPVVALTEVLDAARKLAARVEFNRTAWPEAQKVAQAIDAYDAGVRRVATLFEALEDDRGDE